MPQPFEQPVTRPWAAKVASALRAIKNYDPLKIGYKDPLVNFLVGDKDKLADRVAYDLPLTEGRVAGAARVPALVSEAGELADISPPAKGTAAVTLIGKRGLDRLQDAVRMAKWQNTEDVLKLAGSRDWQAQREIVQGAGGIPIPHGRRPVELLHKPTIEHARPFYDTGNLDSNKLHELSYGPQDSVRKFDVTDFFKDPAALRAYPELKEMELLYDPKMSKNSGSYDHFNRRINMGPTKDPQNAERIFYHEGTHHVQAAEGWPLGTSPEHQLVQIGQLSDLRKKLKKDNMALPLELRRHNSLLDEWDKLQRSKGIKGLFKSERADDIAWRMYRDEAGEQVADTGSRAIRDVMKPHEFKAHPHEMFDQRRTSQLLRNFGME